MQGKSFVSILLLILALGASTARSQAPNNSKPSLDNVPNAQYPRVSPDGRITFRVNAPTAQKMQIAPLLGTTANNGYSGLGKAPYDMTKGDDGMWTVTTPPAVPGFHYYAVVIDGVYVTDPSSEVFFHNNKEESGVDVPEPGVDFYLVKDVPHGEVRMIWYYSKITEQWRRVFLYMPPGYDSHPQQRYPVLYLRHGGSEDETCWLKQGRVNFILDNLIAAGKAKPMIVVMESGYARLPGSAPMPDPGAPAPAAAPGAAAGGGPGQNAAGDAVAAVTVKETIPYIDSHYRTIPDRDHRAIAGLSMGARQTLDIGMSNLDKFSAFGVFSRPPMNNFDVGTSFNGALADAAAFNKKVHVFWWGAGTAETGIFNSLKSTRAALDAAGIKYTYVEYPGLAHEFGSWRKQINEFAPLLFKW